MNWFINIFSAFSQLLNSIIGGNPNESVSGRAYRTRETQPWKSVYNAINAIVFWQEDHCKQAFMTDFFNGEDLYKESLKANTDKEAVDQLLPKQKLEPEIESNPSPVKKKVRKKAPATNGMAEDGGQKW